MKYRAGKFLFFARAVRMCFFKEPPSPPSPTRGNTIFQFLLCFFFLDHFSSLLFIIDEVILTHVCSARGIL